MPDKQYPYPGHGTVYTGETLQTGPKSYLISIGTEGSEVPPLEGELVETGPFTDREGIAAWIKDECNRLLSLGGRVTVHLNNAAIARALEQIIGEDGATLDLQSGQFVLNSNGPKQLNP